MFKLILVTVLALLIGAIIYYFFREKKLPSNTIIDKIVVYKSQRKLEAYFGPTLIKTYRISLGKNPVGHKQFEGDSKTPEGSYQIYDKNPNSSFHKNLGISYPNELDMANAALLNKSAGDAIKIHGLRNGTEILGKFQRIQDWTQGCIAVTNSEIDELFEAVKLGTEINIHP